MSHSLIEYAFQLTQMGKPFVLATVVRCERPTSAKPGAQAIIHEDGQVVGWIGGSCAQPVVVREAMRLLRDNGEPLLLRLGSPERETYSGDRAGIRVFPMTCTSGGVLDIYIEPHLPQPQLLLIGESPVVEALKCFAPVLDFAVTQLTRPELDQIQVRERTFILIGTHGQYDEEVLERVLPGPAAYIGMVSSPRRAESCRDYLRASGMDERFIARLKAPAGLDIGAVTPEEIAASILAELVQVRRRPEKDASGWNETKEEQPATSAVQAAVSPILTTAIDPMCGMTVEIAHARHHSTYEGREFYFCCPACKQQFERDPQHALLANER